jgi:hypothetical protein
LQLNRKSERFRSVCQFWSVQDQVREDAAKASPEQETVMTEASVFRQYAKEAMRDSSKASSEDEKRALSELACTWAEAAMASDRVFGSSFSSSPLDAGKAKPPTGF